MLTTQEFTFVTYFICQRILYVAVLNFVFHSIIVITLVSYLIYYGIKSPVDT